VSGFVRLADARELGPAARRALAVRAAAVGALALLLAGLALETSTVRQAHRPTAASVVVLDLSGSIGPAASATIVRTLRAVAAQGGHAGLVLFSDAAQEAVPPTAPARTLLAYLRMFKSTSGTPFPRSAWSDTFSAGTQIGLGLATARRALVRAGVERGRVILVSDVLDSLVDVPLLRHELLTYSRDPSLQLRVAAVPGPDRSMLALFRGLLGRNALAVGRPPASALAGDERGFPFAAVAFAVSIALLLAVYELTNGPLAWRQA